MPAADAASARSSEGDLGSLIRSFKAARLRHVAVPHRVDHGRLKYGHIVITLAGIRSLAMALPDVVEQPHFRLPGFRVADKLLAHLEKGDAHAIVCVGRAEAEAAAADQPDAYEEVWRTGRIFVGLRVDLTRVPQERMQELIEHAWRNRAPKRLVAEYDSR